MVIVLNILLPYGLKLTFHFEEETGTKIFGGMFSFEHQYDVTSVEQKHDIFLFSFCLGQNLHLEFPHMFCILFYTSVSIFLQKFWKHFLSLQKYCK
jgi:hypothetical protein